MLYQFWLALGIGAVCFTIFSFLRDGIPEPIGKIFFMWAAGVMWILFALGTLSVNVKWDAGVLLDYTYMPVNGIESLALIPGFSGILLFLIAYFHTVRLFAYEPLMEQSQQIEKHGIR